MSQICTEDAKNTACACHVALFLIAATQDLDAKMREKSSLTKQLAELKRSKLQCPESCCGSRHDEWRDRSSDIIRQRRVANRYETKLQKKKKDDDSAVVQTIDLVRPPKSEELLKVKPVREF